MRHEKIPVDDYDVARTFPDSWISIPTLTGYSNQYVFDLWIHHWEMQSAKDLKDPREWRMLTFDGSSTHLRTPGLFKEMFHKRVILFQFPPNMTADLQVKDYTCAAYMYIFTIILFIHMYIPSNARLCSLATHSYLVECKTL